MSKAKPSSKSASNEGPSGNSIPCFEGIPEDLESSTKSFLRFLDSENRSKRTIQTYLEAIRAYAEFAIRKNLPTDPTRIRKEHVESFLEDLLEQGYKKATVYNRYRALRSFLGWCSREGEIDANPMAEIPAPRVPQVAIPVIPAESLLKLLRACEGKDFTGRRDRAMVTLFIDTGASRSEMAALRMDSIDLDHRQVKIMDKRGDSRNVRIGKKTTMALGRYLDARKRHRDADAQELWLGLAGPMTHSGIADAIDRIARKAGVQGITANMFRNTFARECLHHGGTERELMTVVGWRSRTSLARHGKSAADRWAKNANRKLSLADRL